MEEILLSGELLQRILLGSQLMDPSLVVFDFLFKIPDLHRLLTLRAACFPPYPDIVGVHNEGDYNEKQKHHQILEILVVDELLEHNYYKGKYLL